MGEAEKEEEREKKKEREKKSVCHRDMLRVGLEEDGRITGKISARELTLEGMGVGTFMIETQLSKLFNFVFHGDLIKTINPPNY